jgi:DNA-binding Xre family transcriptional regulator
VAESTQLLDALKRVLRERGITYAMAAKALGLSEASVKRLFSQRTFTLERLDALCAFAGIDFAELVARAESDRARLEEMSEAQERALVEDPLLLLTMVCALNRWSFERILEEYTLAETDLVQRFARLDRLGLLELLPENRYRLRLTRTFHWRANGPIQRFFMDAVMDDFLAAEGSGAKRLRFVWGQLSAVHAQQLERGIERLVADFEGLADTAARTEDADRLGSSLLIGFRRDWEPAQLRALRRPPDRGDA